MKLTQLLTEIFGEEFKTEKYEFEPHSFKGRVCGKAYCVKCGLVDLNNDFTLWAISKGCNNHNHPDYERVRKKFTRIERNEKT